MTVENLNPRYKKIVCSGSRHFHNMHVISEVLERVTHEMYPQSFFIVHGDCKTGADALVQRYAYRVGNWPIVRYPADWHQYGNAAGTVRNKQMIDEGCDVLLAFITECRKPDCQRTYKHYSHGTDQTIKYAFQKSVSDLQIYDTEGTRVTLDDYLQFQRVGRFHNLFE